MADYLSLVRIPLGIVFLLTAERTLVALGVLFVAGVSDVLDGWVARRHRPADNQTHHRGDWLDPLCDKIFVATVVLGLYLTRRPPLSLLALLLTREILQTIAVTVMRLVPVLHRASRDYDFKAHPLGKATTVVQFFSGGALLLDWSVARPAVYLTAVLGLLTVALYFSRLRQSLQAAPPANEPGSATRTGTRTDR